MGKIRKNEAGFSAVEILIVLVVVALIGGVGYFVYKNQYKAKTATVVPNNTSPVATSPTTQTTDTYTGWKQYCDPLKVGCLKYPTDWKVVEDIAGVQKPNVQFVPPIGSAHPIDVILDFTTRETATLTQGDILLTSELSTHISGLSVYQGIASGYNPYIIIAQTNGLTLNTVTNGHSWTLGAEKDNSTPALTSTDEAKAWFNSTEAKTALQIIQSFTYQ